MPQDKDGAPDVHAPEAWYNLFAGPLWFVLLPFAPIALWRRRKGAKLAALWLTMLAAVYFAGWAVLTHQIDRFLWPGLGLLAALAATGTAAVGGRLGRHLVPAVVLVMALLAFPGEIVWNMKVGKSPGARVLAGLDLPDEYLRRTLGSAWHVVEAVNRLPAGSKVLLVGEARAALFRVPAVYATIFDTNPLEDILERAGSAEDVAAALRGMGVTHLYCNWDELDRLRNPRRSPGYTVTMPDGTQRPPCFALPPAKLELLDAFRRESLEPLVVGGRRIRNPLTGRPAWTHELWRLQGPAQPPRHEGIK